MASCVDLKLSARNYGYGRMTRMERIGKKQDPGLFSRAMGRVALAIDGNFSYERGLQTNSPHDVWRPERRVCVGRTFAAQLRWPDHARTRTSCRRRRAGSWLSGGCS